MVRFHRTENLRGDLCREFSALSFETMIIFKLKKNNALGKGTLFQKIVVDDTGVLVPGPPRVPGPLRVPGPKRE